MNRILSGMQPTGSLHIGNYLGALKNWVCLQSSNECFFCVVDLHAITVPQDPENLRQAVRGTAASYIAAGINPLKSHLFVQSAVAAHSELNWILATQTPLGWLNRMTQYKDKSSKNRDLELLGLYAYPVLMAADILIYKATHVPVGEDQKQHLELTRDIAAAFNRTYKKDYFPLPEPQILGESTRVMSLRDGTKKMSKSEESDYSRINLTDDADTIALKIRKAKTDSEPIPETITALEKRPEAHNLITLYGAFTDQTRDQVLLEYSGQTFSKFKGALTEAIVVQLSPISARIRELLKDPHEIDKILSQGAQQASSLANKNLKEIKNLVGLWQDPKSF